MPEQDSLKELIERQRQLIVEAEKIAREIREERERERAKSSEE